MDSDLLERAAKEISGAPFPSKRSIQKARAALSAPQADVAGIVERLRGMLHETYEKYEDGYYDTPLTHVVREAADLITTLAAQIASLTAERDALLNGLSAIIHCQSHLSRREMREAAADILDKAGLMPRYLGGDQSPFVSRSLAAEAEVKRLREAWQALDKAIARRAGQTSKANSHG